MFSNILGGAAGFPVADLGNKINHSLRFKETATLRRNLQTQFPGSFSATATVSGWWKFANTITDSSPRMIWRSDNVGSKDRGMQIKGDGTIQLRGMQADGFPKDLDGKYRDPSAWYHIVQQSDGTNLKVWINNRVVYNDTTPWASGSNSFNENFDITCNNEANNEINYQLADFVFLDGTAANPDEFARFNEDGVWVPKEHSFTAAQYGANGFKLTFDSSAGVGDDSAPTGASGHTAVNDFTPLNFDTTDVAMWSNMLFSDSTISSTASDINFNSTSTSWSSNTPPTGFNGNTGDFVQSSGTWIFRPTTPLTNVTKVEVFCTNSSPNQQLFLNSANVGGSYTGSAWNTIYNGSATTINNIAGNFVNPNAGNGFSAIRINNTILVDNTDNDVDFKDTPTSNYSTYNPIVKNDPPTLRAANLDATAINNGLVWATQELPNKHLYAEFIRDGASDRFGAGVANADDGFEVGGASDNDYAFMIVYSEFAGNNQIYNESTSPSQTGLTAYNTGDVLGVEWRGDLATRQVNFYINGTQVGSSENVASGGKYYFAVNRAGGGNPPEVLANFGQMPFLAPPTGVSNTTHGMQTDTMPEPAIKNGEEHFLTLLGGGTGTFKFASEATDKTTEAIDFSELDQFTPTTTDVSGRSFILDTLVPTSSTSFTIASGWGWLGVTATIRVSADGTANSWTTISSTQSMEQNSPVTVSHSSNFRYIRIRHNFGTVNFGNLTTTNQPLLSRAQATFPTGAWLIRTREDDGNDAQDNQWQWLDSTRGGTTAITFPFSTAGSTGNFMTTYNAPDLSAFAYCWNAGAPATNGFQIIEDSSPTAGNNVISHNLGKTPEFIITKETNNSNTANIYHTSLGTSHGLLVQNTAEHSNAFRVTAVSNTQFTIAGSNASNPQIHYVWTSVPGFSQFGEYNDAEAFVYTGFKPALLWLKKTGINESWWCADNKRNPHNPVQKYTRLFGQGAETTSSGDRDVDFLSNGFRIRGTDSQISGSAQYVYMCWAEHPFGGENAPPVTAR